MHEISYKKLLYTLCTVSIFFIIFLMSIQQKENEKIKNLKEKIEELNNRKISDSILIYEYQTGLEKFIKIDSSAALKYMRLIEEINIKN